MHKVNFVRNYGELPRMRFCPHHIHNQVGGFASLERPQSIVTLLSWVSPRSSMLPFIPRPGLAVYWPAPAPLTSRLVSLTLNGPLASFHIPCTMHLLLSMLALCIPVFLRVASACNERRPPSLSTMRCQPVVVNVSLNASLRSPFLGRRRSRVDEIIPVTRVLVTLVIPLQPPISGVILRCGRKKPSLGMLTLAMSLRISSWCPRMCPERGWNRTLSTDY
ncbi:hypothetical protein BC826DRAFT_992004 [Russula brevipes]|nr:hypothetical protein BC826DRAFT_992004 [Russula brevipes]